MRPSITQPWVRKAVECGVAKLCPNGTNIDAEDLEQEIYIALMEGRLCVSELRDPVALKQIRKDAPGSRLHSRSPRHEEDAVIYAVAAREWKEAEMNDRRRYHDAFSWVICPPTQLEAVYDRQILREQERLNETGIYLDFEEVEAFIEGDQNAC